MGQEVLVLGAGLAGLVAAHELAERGLRVTVVEPAPFPGGRTSSWTDGRGREVDTGLHVVADHYVNLIEVLGRLGATRRLRWHEKHLYLSTTREPLSWYFSAREPPLHLLRPLLHIPAPARERLGMVRSGLRTAVRTQAELAEFDDITYLEWHRRHHMGDGFLLELAEATSDAATFLSVEEAAARPVLSWMKYMARDRRAGDVGLWQGSLRECLVDPLVRAIERRGGRIRTGTAAIQLEVEGRRVMAARVAPTAATGPCHGASGVLTLTGPAERLSCDHVISAMPVQHFQRLLSPEQAREAGLGGVHALRTTPALSVIVWFDRHIRPAPPAAPLVTGCAMRDLIDLTQQGREAGARGSVYQFVINRARERILRDDEAIVAELVADLQRIWPAAAGARVVDHAVERVEAAMFAAVPGAHRNRPLAGTRLANLFLAGDWTRHELNASMEGATVSGRLAATALLQSMGAPGIALRQAPDPVGLQRLQRARRWLTRQPESSASRTASS